MATATIQHSDLLFTKGGRCVYVSLLHQSLSLCPSRNPSTPNPYPDSLSQMAIHRKPLRNASRAVEKSSVSPCGDSRMGVSPNLRIGQFLPRVLWQNATLTLQFVIISDIFFVEEEKYITFATCRYLYCAQYVVNVKKQTLFGARSRL